MNFKNDNHGNPVDNEAGTELGNIDFPLQMFPSNLVKISTPENAIGIIESLLSQYRDRFTEILCLERQFTNFAFKVEILDETVKSQFSQI